MSFYRYKDRRRVIASEIGVGGWYRKEYNGG